ncbi:transposase [Streptomyces sp. SID4925]|nr:transposase [Streptomyces sp. SID4925]
MEPLLPDRAPRRGGRWRDHRQVIDAIACTYRTGIPWMDLPEHSGSWEGVHDRPRTGQLTAPGRGSAQTSLPRLRASSSGQQGDPEETA